jgi:hypothetical protein
MGAQAAMQGSNTPRIAPFIAHSLQGLVALPVSESNLQNQLSAAPIKIERGPWRAYFAATGGTAVLTAEHGNITILSGAPAL